MFSLCPWKFQFRFPKQYAEMPTFTNPTDIAYRVQGGTPWCGVRGRRAPVKDKGPQRPCEG